MHLLALTRRCVHCGMCLPACPTYDVFHSEMDGPRGRIVLAQALAEHAIAPDDPDLHLHLDRCLGCRACETACPSGVEFGNILELARCQVAAQRRLSWPARFARGILLRRVIPGRRTLRGVAVGFWLYQRTGLQRLVRSLHVLPAGLANLEQLLPPLTLAWRNSRPALAATSGALPPASPATTLAGTSTPGSSALGREQPAPVSASSTSAPIQPTPAPASTPAPARVAFFAGCVQDAFLSGANQATIRVLQKSGCEVVVPAEQTCCGALHAHLDEHELACDLARRNIHAFQSSGAQAVVVNAGGCGAHLKTYGALLAHDPEYADAARRFVEQVFDLSEFLARRAGQDAQALAPARPQRTLRVTYADSCHLRNAQHVIEEPRRLIRAIPGVEYVELEGADRCCGSAGVYNIVHPDIAEQLLSDKVAKILQTGADIVVVTNSGCHFQLQAGLARAGSAVRVMHLAELLDRFCDGRAPAGSGGLAGQEVVYGLQ